MAVILILDKNWKETKCSSTGKWVDNCGMVVLWNTPEQYKECVTNTYNNMDKSHKDHA